MNLLTKFHENRTVNVASRVLTRFYYSHIRKNAPPLGSHFFQANIIMKINVTSRVSTKKNTPPTCNHFHEDWKINVASKELTRKNAPNPGGHFHEDWTINVASIEKNAPPIGSHVFQAKVTNSELIQDIIGTYLLSKFHEDRKINMASRVLTRFYFSHIRKNDPPFCGHVFQPTDIIFELIHDIIGINLLTKKNAPPCGCHVFQANVTIFKLIQDIIKTNLLTKFHEDPTMNENVDGARRTMDKKRSQKLAMSTVPGWPTGGLRSTLPHQDPTMPL
ncbi:hypothetical protein DPMN_171929 [Dreissena polymorpha]|uniref:Uncharacterized protein n=1 Tax=Dreissena polymorpha TaxID=45954 RepID=A0A9D4DYW4_DREPO|nr:hypothetical protein DPMN_171929 [Dreissena polymorpha]